MQRNFKSTPTKITFPGKKISVVRKHFFKKSFIMFLNINIILKYCNISTIEM